MLNHFSRRGLAKGIGLLGLPFLFGMKNNPMAFPSQAGCEMPPIGTSAVLGFLRTFLTINVVYEAQHDGHHATLEDLLGAVATHREHSKRGTGPYEWMSQFTPLAEEILPGYKPDYAIITAGYPRTLDGSQTVADGFRFVLRGPRYTFISDESTAIYMAMTTEGAPTASDLPSATAYPGARSYLNFDDPKESTPTKDSSPR